MPQQGNLPPVTQAPPVRVKAQAPASLLSTQLPAHEPGKAADDGSGSWAPVAHVVLAWLSPGHLAIWSSEPVDG